jgi:hypothetical protein
VNKREEKHGNATRTPIQPTLAKGQSTEFAYAVHDRIDALRNSAAFQNYEHVRDHVLRMKDLEAQLSGTILEPSAYWHEELENFEYMFDAHPLIIDKLRHHSYHITGLHVYDYRSNKDSARELLVQKLKELVKLGGHDLLVPEPPAMGGFGFEIEGQLYNIDTLKFYEVLIAMQRGGVLTDLRKPADRKLVWEIGAGWGGFSHQFKTICSNVTYVIMDFPELFLFSGTYLKTMFPEARVEFFDHGSLGELLSQWRNIDFLFVPNTFLDEFAPDQLDLAINMVSFQEMTSDQVRAYVEKAYDLQSPYLYSLNRDRSPYNQELQSVSDIISERFWPHEIPILPVSYPKMLNKIPKGKGLRARLKKKAAKLDYKHIIGWHRMNPDGEGILASAGWSTLPEGLPPEEVS